MWRTIVDRKTNGNQSEDKMKDEYKSRTFKKN